MRYPTFQPSTACAVRYAFKGHDLIQWRALCQLCGLYDDARLEDIIKRLYQLGLKHGLTNTPEFSVLHQAIGRCGPKAPKEIRRNYYERGITVCAGFHSIAHFVAVLGRRPNPKLTLERIDNNKGYWCGACDECHRRRRKLNCKWATRTEQARNTRRNKFVTIGREKKTVTEWARAHGILVRTAFTRIAAGWDPVVAVTLAPLRGGE